MDRSLFFDALTRTLEQRIGASPDAARALARAIADDVAALEPELAALDASPSPIDRRVRDAALFLATIRVLRRDHDDATIRDVCLAIAHRLVTPRHALAGLGRRVQGRLARTRAFGWGMERLVRRLEVLPRPAEGFEVRFVPRDPGGAHAFGYDILRCGIVTLFTRHGLARYVPILCEIDHLTSAIAGLELVRQGTIAGGATHCDFRFRPT